MSMVVNTIDKDVELFLLEVGDYASIDSNGDIVIKKDNFKLLQPFFSSASGKTVARRVYNAYIKLTPKRKKYFRDVLLTSIEKVKEERSSYASLVFLVTVSFYIFPGDKFSSLFDCDFFSKVGRYISRKELFILEMAVNLFSKGEKEKV